MAIEKGWWPDGEERSVVEQVNNFHAKIAEAWEEYRAGRMETWYSEDGVAIRSDAVSHCGPHVIAGRIERGLLKPEGFWVEIADLLIRIADTMGAYGWEYKPMGGVVFTDVPLFVKYLRKMCGSLDNEFDDKWQFMLCVKYATWIIRTCLKTADSHGVDLLDLCELKMAYNATRPMRHGGKLA
jgi:hypothetical protein